MARSNLFCSDNRSVLRSVTPSGMLYVMTRYILRSKGGSPGTPYASFIHQQHDAGIAQGGQRIAKLDENVRVWCRTMLSSALSYRHIRYKDVRSSDLRKYCFCDMRCSWDVLRVAVDDRHVIVRVVVGDPLRGVLQRRLNEAPISGIRQVGLPRVENDAIHLEHGQTM